MACLLCAILLPVALRAQAEGTIHQEFRYKLPKPSLQWTAIGGLPSGLQIIGNNEIWGSSNEAGEYKLTLQASDGTQLALGLKVNALWNLSLTPPQAGVGVPFSHELVIRGGTPPYTFGASELPPGLKMLSSDGVIFGTPTAAGAYSVSIVV